MRWGVIKRDGRERENKGERRGKIKYIEIGKYRKRNKKFKRNRHK
jgi:hypothetical protein